HDRFVVAAHHHAFERLARAGVDFLVGYERRHIDEIAWTGFGGEFQPLAPTHARLAAHHVDDALQFAVVMCPGLGVGANVHGACPNLLGADPGIVDRSLAIHAWRLWGVGIERTTRNDAHAVVLPFGCPFAVGFDVHVVALVCGRHPRHSASEDARKRAYNPGFMAIVPAAPRSQSVWPLPRRGTALWPCRRIPAARTWGWNRRRCRRRPGHTSCRL